MEFFKAGTVGDLFGRASQAVSSAAHYVSAPSREERKQIKADRDVILAVLAEKNYRIPDIRFVITKRVDNGSGDNTEKCFMVFRYCGLENPDMIETPLVGQSTHEEGIELKFPVHACVERTARAISFPVYKFPNGAKAAYNPTRFIVARESIDGLAQLMKTYGCYELFPTGEPVEDAERKHQAARHAYQLNI